LAEFAAPLDSLWGVAAHDKLGNSHSPLFSQSGRLGGKSTGVLSGPVPGGLALCHDTSHIQHLSAIRANSTPSCSRLPWPDNSGPPPAWFTFWFTPR
jgi:hypothetical protein